MQVVVGVSEPLPWLDPRNGMEMGGFISVWTLEDNLLSFGPLDGYVTRGNERYEHLLHLLCDKAQRQQSKGFRFPAVPFFRLQDFKSPDLRLGGILASGLPGGASLYQDPWRVDWLCQGGILKRIVGVTKGSKARGSKVCCNGTLVLEKLNNLNFLWVPKRL